MVQKNSPMLARKRHGLLNGRAFVSVCACIAISFLFSCSSMGNMRSSGRFGVGITSDILPNFVNFLLDGSSVSKVTLAEQKQEEERFSTALKQCRDILETLYSEVSPYQSSIDRIRKNLDNTNKKLNRLALWETLSTQQKREFATAYVLEKNPHFKVLNEERWSRNVDLEINELNKASPESLRKLKLGYEKELEELTRASKLKLDSLMRKIELAPDAVAYFYKARCDALSRRANLKKMKLPVEFEHYSRELKAGGVIREQAVAIGMQKRRLNALVLRAAREHAWAQSAKSQNLVNLFNSIFVNGFLYVGDNSYSNGSFAKWLDIDVNRKLGDVVALTQDDSAGNFASTCNTAAILQAQATMAVVRELYGDFLHPVGMSLEHLADPGNGVEVNVRRKILELESDLRSSAPALSGRAYADYVEWCEYQALIKLSAECNRIVRAALIANIRNQERAEFIYEQRIRNLLGSTLKVSGALFYNIN